MNVPRLMALFHLSFVAIGILTLVLIAGEIILFDWLALWVTLIAIALNAFFMVLWLDEASKKAPEPQIVATAKLEPTFPMISLIASTYNSEPATPDYIKNLFDCAQNYRGPSEIIIVDDGSNDNTFESAWTTITSLQKELPHLRAHIIKHTAHLGKKEAAKTGTNKAMGEYVILIDPTTPCHEISLNKIVDSALIAERGTVSIPPSRAKEGQEKPIELYRANSLRSLLNEEQGKKDVQEPQL